MLDFLSMIEVTGEAVFIRKIKVEETQFQIYIPVANYFTPKLLGLTCAIQTPLLSPLGITSSSDSFYSSQLGCIGRRVGQHLAMTLEITSRPHRAPGWSAWHLGIISRWDNGYDNARLHLDVIRRSHSCMPPSLSRYSYGLRIIS